MDILDWVTETASSLPLALVWALGAIFAFLEAGLGLGFFLPGETIVLLLSASLDTPSKAVALLACVAIGASAGDHVGYLLGRRLGPRLRETRIIVRLGAANWDRAVAVLEKRGARAVLLTRMVPVVRTLTPAAAGTAGVPYLRFLPASLVGATLWALLYVGLGYLMRSSLDAVEKYLGNAGWILLAVAATVVVSIVVVRTVRRRRRPPLPDDAELAIGVGAERITEVAPVRRTVRNRLAGRHGATALFAVRLVVIVAAALAAAQTFYFIAGVLLLLALVAKPLQAQLRLDATRSHWTEPTLDRVTALLVVGGFVVDQFLPWQLLLLLLVPEALLGIGTLLAVRGVLPLPVGRLERARAFTQLSGVTAIAIGLSGLVHLPLVVAPATLVLVGLLLVLAGLLLTYVVAVRHARSMLLVWQRQQARS